MGTLTTFRLLYFIERDRKFDNGKVINALVKMPAHGGKQTVLFEERTQCLHSLAMDNANLNIYWNLGCRKQINEMKIDGTEHRIIYDGNDMVVANAVSEGIAYFDQIVYWTDTERVFKLNTATNSLEQIFSNGLTGGIRVFHSSLQPSGMHLDQHS